VPQRPLRPRLVVVSLLALGAYLLWNWALSANHDVVALVCGMALIPLLLALAWLLVLGAVRLLTGFARRPRATVVAGSARVAVAESAGAGVAAGAGGQAREGRRSQSSKLAA
jgi:hypothetical protein